MASLSTSTAFSRLRIPVELTQIIVKLLIALLNILDHAVVYAVQHILDAADILQNMVCLLPIGIRSFSFPFSQKDSIDRLEPALEIFDMSTETKPDSAIS